MSIMTEDQVRLLHKLQMVGIPAFIPVNPLSMSSEEAEDFFKMNLPPLEYITAVAEDENHEIVEKRFLGVSENNCRDQMHAWLDENENLNLFQQPNPQFGGGEMWLEYFSQPLKSIHMKALKEAFQRWEIHVPEIPVPKEEQQIEKYKPGIPTQKIFQRLSPEELQEELNRLSSGKGLSPGVQLGFAPSDVQLFEEDMEFLTFLSPLKTLSDDETASLARGEAVEDIVGQKIIHYAVSDTSPVPYYTKLSRNEIKDEIEYFQQNGVFREGISIGHDSKLQGKKEKSIEPFIEPLTDEELDHLEDNTLSNQNKLSGQKLLGFTMPQEVPVFRRLTAKELTKELESFQQTGEFSSPEVSIGHIPERETHKKKFYKPLVPLERKYKRALAQGKDIRNQDILAGQKFVCSTPPIPAIPVFEKNFSALEVAFDDCPEKRIEIYLAHRKSQEEKAISKVTPEQRAMIKALQEKGKAPKIDRQEYLSFSGRKASEYIAKYESNPENTFLATIYPKRAVESPKAAFPNFKKSNLLTQKQANYLQRSVIRDLVEEGHLASPEDKRELFEKINFITDAQAKELIAPYADAPAGDGLLTQCRSYIKSGQLYHPTEVKTIADVMNLYEMHRNRDYTMKSALKDLIENGYIHSEDALAKIQFSPQKLDEKLISQYGDAKIGKHLRGVLMELVENNEIGQLDDDTFKKLTVRSAMQIISSHAEIERFMDKSPVKTQQVILLRQMEQRKLISLEKIDFQKLTAHVAQQLINQCFDKSREEAGKLPASEKQRFLVRKLIEGKLLDKLPYAEWKNLTSGRASHLIESVPEFKRDELMKTQAATYTRTPVRTTALER